MDHHPYILNAACNLLGICFIIIGSLKLADLNSRSYGDETAWVAASLFFISIVTSYLAVRNKNEKEWQLLVADYAFIIGLAALMASVCLAAISI
jgi:nicotinamide riboside transporter PnuC